MKYLVFLLLFVTTVAATCHKTARVKTAENQLQKNCFKAKLLIKGICMNYVIQVLEGDTTKLQLEKNWRDESDGKTYRNVFALGSRCSFPDMAEGSEFYFSVSDQEDASCNVCLAYRPVPAAKNSITVSQTACP